MGCNVSICKTQVLYKNILELFRDDPHSNNDQIHAQFLKMSPCGTTWELSRTWNQSLFISQEWVSLTHKNEFILNNNCVVIDLYLSVNVLSEHHVWFVHVHPNVCAEFETEVHGGIHHQKNSNFAKCYSSTQDACCSCLHRRVACEREEHWARGYALFPRWTRGEWPDQHACNMALHARATHIMRCKTWKHTYCMSYIYAFSLTMRLIMSSTCRGCGFLSQRSIWRTISI